MSSYNRLCVHTSTCTSSPSCLCLNLCNAWLYNAGWKWLPDLALSLRKYVSRITSFHFGSKIYAHRCQKYAHVRTCCWYRHNKNTCTCTIVRIYCMYKLRARARMCVYTVCTSYMHMHDCAYTFYLQATCTCMIVRIYCMYKLRARARIVRIHFISK
jgi:hypothetical protein